jgi:hypothetical protein
VRSRIGLVTGRLESSSLVVIVMASQVRQRVPMVVLIGVGVLGYRDRRQTVELGHS